jgi:hypothetical protein
VPYIRGIIDLFLIQSDDCKSEALMEEKFLKNPGIIEIVSFRVLLSRSDGITIA